MNAHAASSLLFAKSTCGRIECKAAKELAAIAHIFRLLFFSLVVVLALVVVSSSSLVMTSSSSPMLLLLLCANRIEDAARRSRTLCRRFGPTKSSRRSRWCVRLLFGPTPSEAPRHDTTGENDDAFRSGQANILRSLSLSLSLSLSRCNTHFILYKKGGVFEIPYTSNKERVNRGQQDRVRDVTLLLLL